MIWVSLFLSRILGIGELGGCRKEANGAESLCGWTVCRLTFMSILCHPGCRLARGLGPLSQLSFPIPVCDFGSLSASTHSWKDRALSPCFTKCPGARRTLGPAWPLQSGAWVSEGEWDGGPPWQAWRGPRWPLRCSGSADAISSLCLEETLTAHLWRGVWESAGPSAGHELTTTCTPVLSAGTWELPNFRAEKSKRRHRNCLLNWLNFIMGPPGEALWSGAVFSQVLGVGSLLWQLSLCYSCPSCRADPASCFSLSCVCVCVCVCACATMFVLWGCVSLYDCVCWMWINASVPSWMYVCVCTDDCAFVCSWLCVCRISVCTHGCLYMGVCASACTHSCVSGRVYWSVYAHMCVSLSVCVCVFLTVCALDCLQKCLHQCVYMNVCTCECVRLCARTAVCCG